MNSYYQQSPQQNVPQPKNSKAVERMKKLRLKNPEASPEILLNKIEKTFIKNISLEGGGKAVMGAAIRVVTDKQKSDVRNIGRAAKGGGIPSC